MDLSGSLQGAGGVGGLLAMVSGSDSYTYFYDANGNVGQLVDNSDGSIAAHYEYDPFANLVASNGVLADENPFRFSTKYFDVETGLYYYGLRFYDPVLARWLTRDPIGEKGGLNLYIFAGNDGINNTDSYGAFWTKILIALLEGAGLYVDHVNMPDFINDQMINHYGGPEEFMDETERELLQRGGELPRDMFRKARLKDSDPINKDSTGNEKDLYNRLQALLKESNIYTERKSFILRRLQEGTSYRGFLNVDFQDAGEAALGYAFGGAQLHYYYRVPPKLQLSVIDEYDFTNKGHVWGRLQDRGYLVTYSVNIIVEDLDCPEAADEVR